MEPQNSENSHVVIQLESTGVTDIFIVLVQKKGVEMLGCVQRELYVNQSSSPLMPFDSGLCTESTGLLLAAWLLGRGSVIFSCFSAVYPILLGCAFGAGLCH